MDESLSDVIALGKKKIEEFNNLPESFFDMKRLEGEDYDTYKARRKRANELIKAKLSGHLVHVGTYRK